MIDEIVVCIEGDALNLTIRWQGGDHTPLRVRKNQAGRHRWSTAEDMVELITVLARQMPDQAIASLLNRVAGKEDQQRSQLESLDVCVWRNHRRIEPYRDGDRGERGREATLDEAASTC